VSIPPPQDAATLSELVSYLPPRMWYLTSNGVDMWCRRPYGFFFSSSEAAERFAVQLGSEYGLSAIGIDSKDLLQGEVLGVLRDLDVTRLFLDPAIDPQSGDVFGRILRLDAIN